MTEKFDNEFHKKYVSGEGEVRESEGTASLLSGERVMTYERVLAEYRKYINDPSAELPDSVLKAFFLEKPRTENDRE